MALRWHRQALEDLRGIHEYIANGSPASASRVVASIRDQVNILCEHPTIGRPGRLPDTRELVVSHYPYVVAYRENGANVEILLVVHTSRRWPKELR
ncbi:MAG: type II toxin-antitoxin system RelE/ParE family toxin [Sterolibacteriaceae bacterium MAG5]|nr:type II toxin-antitoxin system RelE/ParE family toxin [Candidatus Nitricoxidireducens bremensis]